MFAKEYFNGWSLVAVLFCAMCLVLGGSKGQAEDLFSARLIVTPMDKPITAGGQVTLAVEASGVGLHYRWQLTGPGTLDGDLNGVGVIYQAPQHVDDPQATATVTVTVTDAQGHKVEKTHALTINGSVYRIIFDSPRDGDTVYTTPIPAQGRVEGGPIKDGMTLEIKIHTDKWYDQGIAEVGNGGSWRVAAIHLGGTRHEVLAELFDSNGKLLGSKTIWVKKVTRAQ